MEYSARFHVEISIASWVIVEDVEDPREIFKRRSAEMSNAHRPVHRNMQISRAF